MQNTFPLFQNQLVIIVATEMDQQQVIIRNNNLCHLSDLLFHLLEVITCSMERPHFGLKIRGSPGPLVPPLVLERLRVGSRLRQTTNVNFRVPRDQVFPCALLFVTSTPRLVASCQFCLYQLFWTVFSCKFSILKNSPLESAVCHKHMTLKSGVSNQKQFLSIPYDCSKIKENSPLAPHNCSFRKKKSFFFHFIFL